MRPSRDLAKSWWDLMSTKKMSVIKLSGCTMFAGEAGCPCFRFFCHYVALNRGSAS